MNTPVEVAVAVLIRADGRVLLGRRPAAKVFGGYWEFPGGKVEPGETIPGALAREVREELGADVERAYPWLTRVFTYPHATVRLHFFRVLGWRGEPIAREHDAIAWELPQSVSVSPLLPANGPVLKGLGLSHEYAISRAGALGRTEFLGRLHRRVETGLKLIQLREPGFSREEMRDFSFEAVRIAHSGGALVLVNSDFALARRVGADGVHLNSLQLRSISSRPDLALCGASCHDGQELRLAESLGADFAVLGPVRSTPSHPGAAPIGWDKFRELALGASIPVFALGGTGPDDMDTAWCCGAHGLAMMRGSWAGDAP